MRTHQRQYAIAEFFVLDKLSNLLDFRFTQIHCTIKENTMYLAVFGAFLDFIDIVVGVNHININGDGRSLKKFSPSLSYQPLVEVALIGDVRFTDESQRRRYEAVRGIADMVVNLPRLKSRASIQFI